MTAESMPLRIHPIHLMNSLKRVSAHPVVLPAVIILLLAGTFTSFIPSEEHPS